MAAKSSPRKCAQCKRKRQIVENFDTCATCTDEARKKAETKSRHARNPEAVKERVARYRARKKAAGEVDKSHGRTAWDPEAREKAKVARRAVKAVLEGKPVPPPPPPPQDPADELAAADTAAPLTKAERRRVTIDEAVEIEMARRELARRSLLHFVKRRNPKYMAGWVHEDICRRLDKFSEDVANGLSPRLMLFMPPRHGKSMLCSEEFPAKHLGNYPDHQIIGTSYAETLALDFSRKVQSIVETEDFELLFEKTRLKDDSRSIERWSTTENGAYTAAGVGGPITGRGAHILIIDDPVKNREEAESAKTREVVKNWYTSTAYSRLMPGGGVLVIQTRWHDDDLAGWLITQMQEAEKAFAESGEWPDDADRWEVVRYPAIAIDDEEFRKKGEALHPARYPLSSLKKIRRTLGGETGRDWNALYQQNPVPESGEYFTKDHIRLYDGAAPGGISIISACDLAISKEDYANHSVILTVGVDEKDDIYVLEARRGKWDSMEIVDELINVYRTYRPQLIGIESTHIEKAIGPFLEKRIREEKLWAMAIEPLMPGKRDKQLRARPIQGRMRQGKVLFPKGAAWMEWLQNELLRFPSSPHDDGVDALAWIGQMMNQVQYTPPPKKAPASWKDRLAGFVSGALNVKNPAMAA